MRSIILVCCICLLACSSVRATEANVRLPAFQRVTLDNGATVLLMPRQDVPLVAASVWVRGGSLADAPGKEGSARLLADLLSKGAGERDALQFAQTVDGAGGSLYFASSTEAITAQAQFLAKDSDLMLSLLADALQRPHLQQAEFDKLRQRAIDSLASAKDSDPSALIDSYADAWLFRGHPYGRPSDGDETSLAKITLTDLQQFRAQQMGGDRLILALAGDFDAKTMLKQVRHAFADWKRASGELPPLTAKPREHGRRVLLVNKPGATQTYFSLMNVGSAYGDPAAAAQDLVQTVFGGRFTSMLNTELRIKSGLSYGARASIERRRVPGAVTISSFTKTASTQAAIDLAIATLDRLHHDGMNAAMLASAKNYIAGQFAPQLETASQLAAQLAELALYDQSRALIDGYLGRVAAATASEVATARAVFPASSDLVIVAIGDAKKIRQTMARYGALTEMQISDPHFAPPPADQR